MKIQSESEYQNLSMELVINSEHPLFGESDEDQKYLSSTLKKLEEWRESNPEPLSEEKESTKASLHEKGFWKDLNPPCEHIELEDINF
ncbi:hypothetical protein ACODM8_16180 [Vibrio ostreicida]|uniref:hypothetical protein n=1 Tax=Vibrio ostreicida TaxID=526588 RepID=UPI003B5C697D